MRRLSSIVFGIAVAACSSSSSTSSSSAETAGSGSQSASPPKVDLLQAAQAKAFRSAWADTPVTPGSIFGALVIGGSLSDVVAHYTKAKREFAKEFRTPLEEEPKLLAMFASSQLVIAAELKHERIIRLGLWTNVEHDKGCPPDLAPALREAWKIAPHVVRDQSDVWLDPTRRIRARLATGEQCRLEFEGYEPAETWVDNVARLDLVGKPTSALAKLGVPEAQWKSGNGQVQWSGIGCGFGGGVASVYADLEDHTIVRIVATTYGGDASTLDAVAASLTARHGPPREVTGLSVRRLAWDRPVPLRLDTDDGRIEVQAGRLRP